jgi:hypothetical protein
MVQLICKPTSEHLDMLKLSKDVMCVECNERKLEVPWPNFITQGVSPRRDVVYHWNFRLSNERPEQAFPTFESGGMADSDRHFGQR